MADGRYANGKIYRLVNSVDNEEYVGSTCTTLAKRKSRHKQHARTYTTRCVYQHLNAIGWDNVDIVLIEEYPCDSKMELERRERYWIETLKPILNKNVPTRTHQEYSIDNADKIKEYKHTYRQQNTDKLKEYAHEHYQKNADKIKEQTREYKEQNADKIKDRRREYRQQNADRIKEQKREYRLRKKAEREAQQSS